MPRKPGPDPVIQKYIDHLNRLLNSTITRSRLVFLELERPSEFRLITRFQNQQILPLELNPHGFLHFMQLVRREGNHVEISEGRYVFSESANPDDESAWFLRYEYERSPAPGKPQGHLHVNAERKGINIKHIHLPVSRISIEQLIAHLILEHEIQSLDPKAMEILAESHRGFLKRRTDFETDAFP